MPNPNRSQRGATRSSTPRGGVLPVPLELRKRPVQARGRATYQRILDATGALLEEGGLEAVSTNAVAERAATNIAAVYKYFPNKLAIIKALFESQAEARASTIRRFSALLKEGRDWRNAVASTTDELIRLRAAQPGNTALRHAMKASHELRAIDRAFNEGAAAVLAKDIARRGLVTGAAARLRALVAVEIATALLDMESSALAVKPRAMGEQITAAIVGYLAPCFEPAAVAASATHGPGREEGDGT